MLQIVANRETTREAEAGAKLPRFESPLGSSASTSGRPPLAQLVHDLAQPLSVIGNLACACATVLSPSDERELGERLQAAESLELTQRWMSSIRREVSRAAALIHSLQAIAVDDPLPLGGPITPAGRTREGTGTATERTREMNHPSFATTGVAPDLQRSTPMLERPTIFVVDDDEPTRDSVCAFAFAKGFRTVAYGSGEEFLASLPDQPGCVITDYKMNGISGLELQEELAVRGSQLPVIVVSGHATVAVAVRAMANGAITLLEKPYTDDDLMAAIHRALAMGNQRRERSRRRRELAERYESLSEEELQVLRLLLNGAPNKVVSNRLSIGLRTVERRRHDILQKMGVQTIAQVARLLTMIEGEEAISEPKSAAVNA